MGGTELSDGLFRDDVIAVEYSNLRSLCALAML